MLMIRYKKLGYVALNVTNIEKSTEFYREMVGLELVEKRQDIAFLRCSSDHHNFILYSSEKPGIKRVAFELEDEAQFDIAVEKIRKAGISPYVIPEAESNALYQGKTIRFVEPNTGLTFELYSQIKQIEDPYVPKVKGVKPTKITQLGHAVVDVEDEKFDGALQFFMDTMNFKVSDFSGDKIGWSWMRAFPNPLHHTFAIVRGNQSKLNHIAFMTEDIDSIGIGRNRLLDHSIPIVFGPGRHKPSGSIFLYFLDPDGMTLEFSNGMEEFPEENPRQPRILEPNLDTLDLWGSTPDPRFSAVGEIEKGM